MKKTTLLTVALLLGIALGAPGALAQPAPGAAAPAAAPSPVAAPASGTAAPALPTRDAAAQLDGLEVEPGGLTADEVARRALVASANVKDKRAQLSAANERITQTMVQFFPRLTLLASYTRLSPVKVNFGSGALVGALNPGPLSTGPCPGGAGTCVLDSAGTPVGAQPFAIKQLTTNYTLAARLSVPISDYVLRITDAAASSKASREAARIAVEAEVLKVQSDARILYFNWLRARGQAAIAEKAVERTRARLSDAQASFGVGSISKADLLRIEALVANTELTHERAVSFQHLTAGQLAIVMEDPHPAYRVGEGIPQPDAIAPADRPIEAMVAEAHAQRLEMKAMDETVHALSHGADATRAGALPRLDGVADLTYANPNQRYFPPQQKFYATWSVGVQASWTIDDLFSVSAAGRELDANAESMMAKRTALRAGIAQEVLAAYLDLARARTAFEKQRAALAAAEEGYRVTTDLFQAGRATSTDLIEAEGQLSEAKFGDVNARIDLTVASIALRHATARDIPRR